jgi:hypothetical protein
MKWSDEAVVEAVNAAYTAGQENQEGRVMRPRTKAGRALLEALSNLAADLPLEFGDEPLERLDIEATLGAIVAIEREAAVPATEALRAALVAVNAAIDKDRDGDAVESDLLEAHAILEARASDAGPAALDVERLARAIEGCEGIYWPNHWTLTDYKWIARQLAAEYARLTSDGPRRG